MNTLPRFTVAHPYKSTSTTSLVLINRIFIVYYREETRKD